MVFCASTTEVVVVDFVFHPSSVAQSAPFNRVGYTRAPALIGLLPEDSRNAIVLLRVLRNCIDQHDYFIQSVQDKSSPLDEPKF